MTYTTLPHQRRLFLSLSLSPRLARSPILHERQGQRSERFPHSRLRLGPPTIVPHHPPHREALRVRRHHLGARDAL